MYLAPACAFWLFLGVLVLEWPSMLREGAITLVAQHPAKFCAAAVMGFGVNSLAYAVIQLSSSLTLKVRRRRTLLLGGRWACCVGCCCWDLQPSLV